jgi:hypothetical protein
MRNGMDNSASQVNGFNVAPPLVVLMFGSAPDVLVLGKSREVNRMFIWLLGSEHNERFCTVAHKAP